MRPDRRAPDAPPHPAALEDVATRLRSAGCVYAEDEARLLIAGVRTQDELDALIARRVAGDPLEHVLGWAELCGLRIAVDPGVFVPRRRSELLARQAVGQAHARADPGPVHVVDLCCGSGALAAVVTASVDRVSPYAVDVDPAAVACARRNLPAERVFHGDLYAPLPSHLRGQIDVVVANAPYVPTAQLQFLPGEARLHEARIACDGGPDGLDVHRRLIARAPAWLAPGGVLLVETSAEQAPQVVRMAADAGLRPTVVADDDLEATVVRAHA